MIDKPAVHAYNKIKYRETRLSDNENGKQTHGGESWVHWLSWIPLV